MPRYNPAVVEAKWQKYWEDEPHVRRPPAPNGPKVYVLDMFPYPSGDGLHVGHPEGYTATDIVCRYQRMRGCAVMHPMGWDAFGLPAEQHAKQTGTHPRTTTEQNIAQFPPAVEDARLQLRLGPRAGHDRPRITSAGRSSSFWSSSTPGSIPSSRRAGRSPNCPSRRKWPRRATTPSSVIATSTGWPISSRRRSIGARPWAPCWPTRKCRAA